jgi:cell division septation protein DedD
MAFTALYQRLSGYPNFKPLLRWTVVGLVGIGLAVLVANTASHLLQSKPTSQEIETPQVVEITDPFTLQVAAYLKSEHAEKYVQQLKDQGMDAYWTVAQGVKRKWYQVRISHFADKDSARTYGEDLKSRGIIDDFYVANYQSP